MGMRDCDDNNERRVGTYAVQVPSAPIRASVEELRNHRRRTATERELRQVQGRVEGAWPDAPKSELATLEHVPIDDISVTLGGNGEENRIHDWLGDNNEQRVILKGKVLSVQALEPDYGLNLARKPDHSFSSPALLLVTRPLRGAGADAYDMQILQKGDKNVAGEMYLCATVMVSTRTIWGRGITCGAITSCPCLQRHRRRGSTTSADIDGEATNIKSS